MTHHDPQKRMPPHDEDRLPLGFTPEFLANMAYFESRLPDLLPEHGRRWALVHRQTLVAIFDTEDAAHDAGRATFGLEPIFLGHIVSEPDVEFMLSFEGVRGASGA